MYDMYEIKKRLERINHDMLKYVDQEEKACIQALYLNGYRKINHGISCGCPDICIVSVFNPATKHSKGFRVDKNSMLQYIPNDEYACKMFEEMCTKEHEEYENKCKERMEKFYQERKEKTLLGKLCKTIKHYVDCIEE
jgi:hypothetical protein